MQRLIRLPPALTAAVYAGDLETMRAYMRGDFDSPEHRRSKELAANLRGLLPEKIARNVRENAIERYVFGRLSSGRIDPRKALGEERGARIVINRAVREYVRNRPISTFGIVLHTVGLVSSIAGGLPGIIAEAASEILQRQMERRAVRRIRVV